MKKLDIHFDSTELTKISHMGAVIHLNIPSDRDHIGRHLKQTGSFYELELLEALSHFIRPDDLVVDVGANIGNHSLFFSAVTGATVVAFEPVPSISEILQSNVNLNNLNDNVEVRTRGLGSEPGQAVIALFDPDNVGGTTLSSNLKGDIEISSLDTEQFLKKITVLKIDAEGMDLEVLRGASETIERDRPVIAVEAITLESQRAVREILSFHSYTPVGNYNSSPTFIFLPNRSFDEARKVVDYLGHATIANQLSSRNNSDLIHQVSRYAERLTKEINMTLGERIKTLESVYTNDDGVVLNGNSSNPTPQKEQNERQSELRNAQLTLETTKSLRLNKSLNRAHSQVHDLTIVIESQTKRFETVSEALAEHIKNDNNRWLMLEIETGIPASDIPQILLSMRNQLATSTSRIVDLEQQLRLESRLKKELIVSRGAYARDAVSSQSQVLVLRQQAENSKRELVRIKNSKRFTFGEEIRKRSRTFRGTLTLIWIIPIRLISGYKNRRSAK